MNGEIKPNSPSLKQGLFKSFRIIKNILLT